MSGIVAMLSLDEAPLERPLLGRMMESLAVRGPDGQGVWPDDGAAGQGTPAALGHSILRSTSDTRSAPQPASLDGRVWVTADARVDGRPELIRELRARGRAVSDDADDVELILHAYHVWGDACLAHLIGDFAFVLWDAPQQRLFAACDHFGVVPLFYARAGRALICSNTLDCLRRHPQVSATLSEEAVADYLAIGHNLEPAATIFADIRRLPAGHRLTWSRGVIEVAPYWRLPVPDTPLRYRRLEEYVQQFRGLLSQAVGDRLRIGQAAVLMSGGLDSTSVAAVAKEWVVKRAPTADLCAYTWVHDDVMLDDERRYSSLVADALGIPIRHLVVEDTFHEDPRGHPECVTPTPTGFTHPRDNRMPLRLAALHTRVVLSGQGGDVALWRDEWYWIRLLARGRVDHALADVWRNYRRHGRRPPFYVRTNWRRWRGRPLWQTRCPAWLRADVAARVGVTDRLRRVTDPRSDERGRTGMGAPFWTSLLARLDPGSTGVRVKVRFPFFDLRLIRYLAAVPTVPWLLDKHLLRAAMQGVLPEPVRLRPKTNLASWPYHALAVKRGVPAWMEDLAASPELAPYAERGRLIETLRAPATVPDHEYQAVVRALILADWLRKQDGRRSGGLQSTAASTGDLAERSSAA